MCDYCEAVGDSENIVTCEPIEFSDDALKVEGAAFINKFEQELQGRITNDGGETWLPFRLAINFCPICGKPLHESGARWLGLKDGKLEIEDA